MATDLDKIARAALSLPEWAIVNWPGGVGRRLREAYWRKRLGRMGVGCAIDVGVIIVNPQHVFLGDHVWIDNYVHLIAGPPGAPERITIKENPAFRGRIGEIHVGSNTHIAPHCVVQGHGGVSIGRDTGVASHSVIYSLSHHYRKPGQPAGFDGVYEHVMKFTPMAPVDQQALIAAPAVLEDATALGLGSIVLPGATVGRYTWIGVGSVVQGTVEPGVIAAGNPLKILKQRFGEPITDGR